jgi:hypothetical protein
MESAPQATISHKAIGQTSFYLENSPAPPPTIGEYHAAGDSPGKLARTLPKSPERRNGNRTSLPP